MKGLQLSTRAAAAAGLAVMLAQWLKLPLPIYAMLGAVIVTDLSPAQTRRLAVPRVAGTVLGATLGAALSTVVTPNPGAVAVSVFVAMFLSHVVQLRDSAKLAGYVCCIAALSHGTDPWSYAWYRLAETLLGVGTAVLVSHVPRLMGAAEEGG